MFLHWGLGFCRLLEDLWPFAVVGHGMFLASTARCGVEPQGAILMN